LAVLSNLRLIGRGKRIDAVKSSKSQQESAMTRIENQVLMVASPALSTTEQSCYISGIAQQ